MLKISNKCILFYNINEIFYSESVFDNKLLNKGLFEKSKYKYNNINLINIKLTLLTFTTAL